MNYFPPFLSSPNYRQQTESGAYEPIVQFAQVGSKISFREGKPPKHVSFCSTLRIFGPGNKGFLAVYWLIAQISKCHYSFVFIEPGFPQYLDIFIGHMMEGS